MCPPSSEPIRPVGPVAGDVYVGRAELPWRVARRDRRDDEADEQGRRRRRHAQQEQVGERPTDPADLDAGTYDDHGRTHHRDDDDAPPAHRHVDATA